MKKRLVGSVIGVALLICCTRLGILRSIVLGWFLFLMHTLPRITVDWPSVLVGCIALVLFTAGIRASGQAWRRRSPNEPTWKLRWSLAIVAVTFLLFASGISLVAIVHQAGWLLTSREPYYVQAVQVRGAWDSRDNLKQIGYALQNHDGMYGSLPAGGTFAPDGSMLHSWETRILFYYPYSTADIDFTVPWNHPRNAKYFQCIIPQFLNDSLPSPPLLDEQGFGLSHYSANSRVMGGNKSMRLQDITDGLSNTLLVGEINAGFKPWGHPVNWRDPAKGISRSPQGFGGAPHAGGAYFSMADGSVRFVSERISTGVLRALGTPDGGEEIDSSILGPPR